MWWHRGITKRLTHSHEVSQVALLYRCLEIILGNYFGSDRMQNDRLVHD